MSLTGFSRCFLSGEHRRRGRGAGKNITKPRFDRVILAGCVWKWQGVLPLFTFDAISLVPFALPTLPLPQRHQTFSIALRPYYRRFPSFPILSFLLLTLHPCLFPGGIVSISLWRARIRYRSSFYLFHLPRQINDRLKYNSFTQREERDNSIVDRIWKDRFEKEFIHFATFFMVFFKMRKCFWKNFVRATFAASTVFTDVFLLKLVRMKRPSLHRAEKGLSNSF